MAAGWAVVLEGVVLFGGDQVGVGWDTTPWDTTPWDSVFNSDSGRGCLTSPPAGVGVPGLRTEDVQFPQRDGAAHYSDWYEPRTITMEDVILHSDGCPNCPDVREKAAALMDAWSRKCEDVELVLFTDCHGSEPPTGGTGAITGPFGVRGRPRAAELEWQRGRAKRATATLRFDSVDHRMYILDSNGTPGSGGQVFSLTRQQRSPDVLTPGGNTVLNPSFEIAGAGFLAANWSAGERRVSNFNSQTPAARTGSWMLTLGNGLSSASTSFAVAAGGAFEFHVWAESHIAIDVEPHVASATIDFDTGADLSLARNVRGFSWQEIAINGTVPAGATTATIVLTRISTGSPFPIHFDDVSYIQYPAPLFPTLQNINIAGSLCTPLVITFTGKLTHPRVTLADGDYVEFSSFLGTGQTVVIDTATGTVTGTGFPASTNLYALISGDPFLEVNSGVAQLMFTTLENTDTGAASLSYRPAVISA